MGSIIKWALLLGGGYWLYEAYVGSQTSTPGLLTSGAPSYLPPTTTPPTTVPTLPPSTPAAGGLASIRSRLQALADADLAANPTQGGLDVDQWAYYYAQIRGITLPGSTVESILQTLGVPDTGSARQTHVSIDQFLSAAAAAGLSGYGRGMGAVPVLRLRNRGRVITLPLPVPAIAAVGRARMARRGTNYVRRGTPMTGGAA